LTPSPPRISAQFSESLDKGTPEELLEILRKKVKGQKT